MSLVWGLIAGFLYLEVIIVLILSLPIASPTKWANFFKSRFLAMLRNQAQIYFYLILGVLTLFLLDAIREMRKYSNTDPGSDMHLNIEMQHSMRLFRAQRNFYISGFAIFLTLVIKRLIHLNLEQASLLAQAAASMRQAESASTAARTLMNQQKDGDDKKDNTEIIELKKKVVELEKELVKEKKDREAMKSQAESLNKEYDRLTEEYSKLQRQVTSSAGSDKDD
jgi:B-cell receptor-associated protein 31